MATMTEVKTENRYGQDRCPVWKKVLTFALVSGDDENTAQTIAVEVNGILQKIVVECGACSGANPTFTVAIDDSRNIEMFSVAALAESTPYKYNVQEPMNGTIDVKVTPSTDVLSDTTIVVTLRGV